MLKLPVQNIITSTSICSPSERVKPVSSASTIPLLWCQFDGFSDGAKGTLVWERITCQKGEIKDSIRFYSFKEKTDI